MVHQLGGLILLWACRELTHAAADCHTPRLLLPQEFADYYLSKHGGRKLAWHGTSSNCVVRAHFPLGVKELQASLHQVRVVMNRPAAGIKFFAVCSGFIDPVCLSHNIKC